MSILQIRYCPHCANNTYHRFTCRLRCRFVSEAGWQCISCDKRERELRSRAERLGLSPDSVDKSGRA
ncbi:hypothetical protein [uncultured Pseudodesulfovibrio sp.]|uniref:hypothetical protein n=1 Tax=uncultured Pseudodesulfovibrio sp. TaxID=2035858 RepID=UPI0029C97F77|nr:hypothetical protein [uncultured Pseudodesulfovibrio sp.]